jgi:microcystin-dependent protein
MRFKSFLLATALSASTIPSTASAQALEPFIGETIVVAFDFCPRGWAAAEGQLLVIAQNQALFSLLGTQYGGDGRVTFGLPDLRGRAVINQGQGPGLSNYTIGQPTGTTSFTLTTANLPSHTHTAELKVVPTAGNEGNPVRNSLAAAPAGRTIYSTADPTAAMNSGDINILPTTGGGQSVSNTSPALVMRYCIAVQGIFPVSNTSPALVMRYCIAVQGIFPSRN